MPPDWPAIRIHCARGEWAAAYQDAGDCRGRGDAVWQAAADYIEAEKARALAALTAQWRQHKERPR